MITNGQARFAVMALLAIHLPLAAGCFGLGKRSDATDAFLTKKVVQDLSKIFPEQSNLTRVSGRGLAGRLQKLFPGFFISGFWLAGSRYNELAVHEDTGYGLDPLNAPLESPERPYSTVPQIALKKNWVDYFCNVSKTAPFYNFLKDASSTLFSESGVLMPGETMPVNKSADPALYYAFLIARNAWLYPYKPDSAPVQLLAQYYRDTLAAASSAGDRSVDTPEHFGMQALCYAAFYAPQFLLGQPYPEDVIRRVALELAQRPPTFAEYGDYIGGKTQLGDFVDKLVKEDGFRTTVRQWHREWLNFRKVVSVPLNSLGVDFPNQWDMAASFIDETLLYQFVSLAIAEGNGYYNAGSYPYPYPYIRTGVPYTYSHGGLSLSSPPDTLSGADAISSSDTPVPSNNPTLVWTEWAPSAQINCVPKVQQFDPRTTELKYEKLDGTYVGSWIRDPSTGVWGPTGSLPSVVFNTSGIAPTGWDSSKFFRIRRISPSGEQNGMSPVKLWYTGSTVYVCNSLDRLRVGCAYRPPASTLSDLYRDIGNWTSPILANGQSPIPPIGPGGIHGAMLMTPNGMDSFRCGVPQPLEILKLASGVASTPANSAQYAQDLKAYPLGYDLAFPWTSAPPSPGGINQAANYLHMNSNTANFHDPTFEEQNAYLQVSEDLNEEPFRLLEYTIFGNIRGKDGQLNTPIGAANGGQEQDYSTLLTSSFTFGSAYYELLLRTQGYALPAYPAVFDGFYAPQSDGTASYPDPAAARAIRLIQVPSIPPIPMPYLQNSVGLHAIYLYPTVGMSYAQLTDEQARALDQKKNGQFITQGSHPPKTQSGILTMGGFLDGDDPRGSGGNQALQIRTMAARYFSRLMCMEPNGIKLSSGQDAVNVKYVPMIEKAAKDHLDRTRGCYDCHINMDPLASALSVGFQESVVGFATGQLEALFGAPGTSAYGIRGGGAPSRGAFKGVEVLGLTDGAQTGSRGLASMVAASDEFNNCVARKVFINVYGREPTLADSKAFSAAVQAFKSHRHYTRLIRDLITGGNLSRRN